MIQNSSLAIAIIIAIVAAAMIAFGYREYSRARELVGRGRRETLLSAFYATGIGLIFAAVDAVTFRWIRVVAVSTVAFFVFMTPIYLNYVVKPRIRQREAEADEAFVSNHRLDAP